MAEVLMTTQGFDSVSRRINQLSGQFGVASEFVAADQLRLLTVDLIKFSPPRKAGNTIKKAVGKEAVRTDLENVFAVLPAQRFLDAFLPTHPMVGFTRVEGTPAVWATPTPKVTDSAMRRYHQSLRNRQGRTKPVANTMRNNYTVVGKQHVSRRAFSQYLKLRQKRVGHLASAWLGALDELDRKTRIKSRIPSFIRSAGGKGRGKLQSTMKNGDGTLAAINRVQYASSKYRSILPSLLAKRRVDIGGNLEKRMQNVADRFNKAGAL